LKYDSEWKDIEEEIADPVVSEELSDNWEVGKDF